MNSHDLCTPDMLRLHAAVSLHGITTREFQPGRNCVDISLGDLGATVIFNNCALQFPWASITYVGYDFHKAPGYSLPESVVHPKGPTLARCKAVVVGEATVEAKEAPLLPPKRKRGRPRKNPVAPGKATKKRG